MDTLQEILQHKATEVAARRQRLGLAELQSADRKSVV